MTDILVVGAGTAGLTAAIYGQRAGKQVLMVEKKMYGGQIINTPDIENYPGLAHVSGAEYAEALYGQAVGLGAELVFGTVTGIEDLGSCKRVTTDAGVYEAKAVILATGARNRPLGLPREEALTGRGVSYCATCDGMFFRGKTVAVVGGGNTALEDALFLSNTSARVYLIHRRDVLRGDVRDQEKLRARENVTFLLSSRVTELRGEPRLSAVEVEEIGTGRRYELPVDGLFIAAGQMPENGAFADLVTLDAGGYIVSGENCLTGTPGIFTAGDCRTKEVRQLTTAASDGAVAALAAAKYIDSLR